MNVAQNFFVTGLGCVTVLGALLTVGKFTNRPHRHDTGGMGANTNAVATSAIAYGRRGERQVDDVLRDLGIPTLRNVFLRDMRGRLTEIDLIALVGASILAVEVKTWRGRIIGEATDAVWRQSHQNGWREMKSPCFQNQRQLRVLRANFPAARCTGLVVFNPGAVFPHGLPNGVLDVAGLVRFVDDRRTSAMPDGDTLLAWGQLSARSMRQDKDALNAQVVAWSEALTRNRPPAAVPGIRTSVGRSHHDVP